MTRAVASRAYALAGSILAFACSSKGKERDSRTADPSIPVLSVTDDMVSVPAGWFSSGCSRAITLNTPEPTRAPDGVIDAAFYALSDCIEDEPPRRVWLSAFSIDRMEVTQSDYANCVSAGNCKAISGSWVNVNSVREYDPSLLRRDSEGRSYAPLAFEPNVPVAVSYEGAAQYCAWRGKRLPSAMEWEKAARGTDDRIFPWGDTAPDCQRTDYFGRDANCPSADLNVGGLPGIALRGEPGAGIRPVGKLPSGSSFYGAQDMLDNAPEWVTDWDSGRNAADHDLTECRLSLERAGDHIVINLDWSSVRFKWNDQAYGSSVVNPHTSEPERPKGPLDHKPIHVTKGAGSNPSLTGDSHGSEDMGYYVGAGAGFRCVRDISGELPPTVKPPPVDVFAPPFREPGYTPPGATGSLQRVNCRQRPFE